MRNAKRKEVALLASVIGLTAGSKAIARLTLYIAKRRLFCSIVDFVNNQTRMFGFTTSLGQINDKVNKKAKGNEILKVATGARNITVISRETTHPQKIAHPDL